MEKNTTIEDTASAKLGYLSLKDKQLLVINEFVSGHDALKSLCLSRVYDKVNA